MVEDQKQEQIEVPNKISMKQPNRPPPLKSLSGEESSEYGDYGSEESEECSSDCD